MTNTTTFYAAFTCDQLRAGFARNSASLRVMAAKADKTGRTVNGFDATYLHSKANLYDGLSRATDEVVRAHMNRPLYVGRYAS